MDFGAWWAQLGNTRIVIIVLIVFFIIYIPSMIFYMKNNKKKNQNYMQEHPDASRIYVKNESTKALGMVQEGLYISSVDGEAPLMFTEGMKTGFFLLPGTHIVESTFNHTRPGVTHKTVTHCYGPTKQEIHVEAGKKYKYSFDYANEHYNFEEITE